MRCGTRALVIAAFGAAGTLSSIANGEVIYAVTSQQFLISFDSANPSALLSSSPLSGFAQNERVVGIDFRPATGELFALGSLNNLYRINNSGQVLTGSSVGLNLDGAAFGFDFNPTIDRIRIVTDVNNNYVYNPNTLALQLVATDVFYGPADPNFGFDPNVVHSAYTNNFNGATSTQLYGIDSGLDILVTQANNAGTLGTVGPLGLNVTALGGFDISGQTDVAYAIMQPANDQRSFLYSINLLNGGATNLGQVGGGLTIEAMSVLQVPSVGTVGAMGLLGGLSLARRRR